MGDIIGIGTGYIVIPNKFCRGIIIYLLFKETGKFVTIHCTFYLRMFICIYIYNYDLYKVGNLEHPVQLQNNILSTIVDTGLSLEFFFGEGLPYFLFN